MYLVIDGENIGGSFPQAHSHQIKFPSDIRASFLQGPTRKPKGTREPWAGMTLPSVNTH